MSQVPPPTLADIQAQITAGNIPIDPVEFSQAVLLLLNAIRAAAGGGGSGVQSITAGDNITLGGTASDPVINATPSGSTGDLQWNNDGVLAGVTGDALTANQPFNLAQTWNNGSVAFTGLKFNVTDTASDAASLLMDLRVGGSSVLNVNKAGFVRAGGGLTFGVGTSMFYGSGTWSIDDFNSLYTFSRGDASVLAAINGGGSAILNGGLALGQTPSSSFFTNLAYSSGNLSLSFASNIVLSALPTSDPGVSGALYKTAGAVMQSP